jgi:AcrR family transcriptional regulator
MPPARPPSRPAPAPPPAAAPATAAPATAARPRRPGPRPRRGRPEETRERLVAAAAAEFNRVGYRGTDSNRLARAAGYAPGTFYKHFADKRAIFLAAYEAWVTTEWAAVGRIVAAGGPRETRAARIVDEVLALHRRWRGLRASLRALVAEDATARTFYRRPRRRQIALLAALGGARRPRAEAALLLYVLERVSDAVADGELRDLAVPADDMTALLREVVLRHVP